MENRAAFLFAIVLLIREENYSPRQCLKDKSKSNIFVSFFESTKFYVPSLTVEKEGQLVVNLTSKASNNPST